MSASVGMQDDLLADHGRFLTAREATDRGAYTRWLKSQGIDKTAPPEIRQEATATWHALQPLQDAALRAFAYRVLQESRGRWCKPTDRFPATLWLRGATDVDDGRDFLGTFADFVKVLHERSGKVAAKRTGWVVEPTTNETGQRTNAATKAMHALFLDCDNTGEWHQLLTILDAFDYAYVAYQSGGYTPTSPKWRVVLPLHVAHDTSTALGQRAWKTVYNHARTILGSVANLRSVGFDPATETPACPWFLTEKRDPNDRPRQIIAMLEGHALDLTALTLQLPEVFEEIYEDDTPSYNTVNRLVLDEDGLNKIIDALVPVTEHVPVGRRDLYLALPGVMLDRGVAPDDVVAIIEAVSLACPSAKKYPEKHADNMHNTHTTIGKWQDKTNFTRIGTLNALHPDVAKALDEVLPDPIQLGRLAALEVTLGQQLTVAEAPVPVVVPATPTKKRTKLSDLGKEISKLARTLKASKKTDYRLAGLLIHCYVDCVPLPSMPELSVDEAVNTSMRALGRGLPLVVQWADVLAFAGRALLVMDFTQSEARVAAAEKAFYEGRAKRNKANNKKTANRDAEKRARDEFFGRKGK